MLRRFGQRTATGLRLILDWYGALGMVVLAIAMVLWLMLAHQWAGVPGVVFGIVLMACWPSLFARAMEPDPVDESEYGASFDAMEQRDREILDKASEFERVNKARDQWNLARRPGDNTSRSGVEMCAMPEPTTIVRPGKPAENDVCGQYRLHADCIADGERERPCAALLVEVDSRGLPTVRFFGPRPDGARERMAALTHYAEIILASISDANADASH